MLPWPARLPARDAGARLQQVCDVAGINARTVGCLNQATTILTCAATIYHPMPEPLYLSAFDHIIPLGDHCAAALSLQATQLRQHSFPFDWTSGLEGVELIETTLHKNFAVLKALLTHANKALAAHSYLGGALAGSKVFEGVRFPHDLQNGETAEVATEKYQRRFQRLYAAIAGGHKNLYLIVTRLAPVLPALMADMLATLSPYQPESRFLVISGLDHPYLHPGHAPQQVAFQHIPYDPQQYYSYDYTHFRPTLDAYIASLRGRA